MPRLPVFSTAVRSGDFKRQLSPWELSSIENETGSLVWDGEMPVDHPLTFFGPYDGFADTGLDLHDSASGSAAFSVFSAAFPAGTVTLGSNVDTPASPSAMYTVLVAGSGGGGPPDTDPPSVPTGLAASAVSSTSIELSWSASTDDAGVAGYRVYRDGSEVAYVTGTQHADTGLSPSTTYAYTVTAEDAAGNVSAPSAPAVATPDASPGPGPGGWFHEDEHVFRHIGRTVADLVAAGGRVGVGSHGQLQGLGYPLPDYPDEPKTDDERDVQARYDATQTRLELIRAVFAAEPRVRARYRCGRRLRSRRPR